MDAKNREGRTPVHLASTIRWLGSFAGAEAGLEKLIEAGADISVRTITDNTALHIAADIGCEGVARALVKAGADVDAKNGQGLTPLLVAAGKEEEDGRTEMHTAVCSILLEGGCDKAAADADGNNAMHRAALSGNDEAIPPPRTKWTRLVHPSVLTGHVSSL